MKMRKLGQNANLKIDKRIKELADKLSLNDEWLARTFQRKVNWKTPEELNANTNKIRMRLEMIGIIIIAGLFYFIIPRFLFSSFSLFNRMLFLLSYSLFMIAIGMALIGIKIKSWFPHNDKGGK